MEEYHKIKDKNGREIQMKTSDIFQRLCSSADKMDEFIEASQFVTVKNGGGRDRIFRFKEWNQWIYDKFTLKGLAKTIFSYVGFASTCLVLYYTLLLILNT
jgi:hypothetical protein